MTNAIPGIHILSLLGTIFFALTVIVVRLRAARKPVTELKILIPPLGMSTGFAMFFAPAMRIPWIWGIGAALVGALFFSYPLIRTSKFLVSGRKIYLQRSKSFIVILLVLLAIRLALHSYIEEYVTLAQTGAIFFILAFGMLLPWRVAMYFQFQRMLKVLHGGNHPAYFDEEENRGQ